MDNIKRFDIELEREYYYAGERAKGWVIVDVTENLKVRGVRVLLRGKAHVEWKITKGGERRTVKEEQYFVDDKVVAWGKDKNEDGPIPIMPRGNHKFPFEFRLPESSLPCSFESKVGTIRYYLRVIIDIPYASPPQGLKYFTIIGPRIDATSEAYLTPVNVIKSSSVCCNGLCCSSVPIQLEATLERTAYCSGEKIKLRAEVQNGSDANVWLVCKLRQHVEYKITKYSVLGLLKESVQEVWKYKGPTVAAHHTTEFRHLEQHLQLPVLPPSLNDVCKLIEIYYVLRVSVEKEKSGEELHVDLPIDVATMPYKIANHPDPELKYEVSCPVVEGGMYISPEFQLGQVYDGSDHDHAHDIILYRYYYNFFKIITSYYYYLNNSI